MILLVVMNQVCKLAFFFCRCLLSKGSSYTVILKLYGIDFIYTTRDATSLSRNITIRNLNFAQGQWQHLSLVVYNRQLSVFVNGEIQRTVVLDGIINDVSMNARVGQRSDGRFAY